ncbi:hypothetical protein GJAV_G00236100 [Gymnothorax javanicus]|nr:hypothetical protein GJAV_G00236100 [Gymnothorax javanicus]
MQIAFEPTFLDRVITFARKQTLGSKRSYIGITRFNHVTVYEAITCQLDYHLARIQQFGELGASEPL